MVINQSRSKQKRTGKVYRPARGKRLYETGRPPILTRLAEKRQMKLVRTKGRNYKNKLQSSDLVNVFDSKTKKATKVKILNVVENNANRHYVRRNILTKGCIVDSDKGKVRITSRPGQDGTLNGVFV
jgi:small subunit ribosomal protein S8e